MSIIVDQATIGGDKAGDAVGTSFSFTTIADIAAGATIVLGGGFFGSTAVVTGIAGGSLSWAVDKQDKIANSTVWMGSTYAPDGLDAGEILTVSGSTTINYPTIGGLSLLGIEIASPVEGTPLGGTQVGTAAWSSGAYAISREAVIVAIDYSEGAVTGNTPTSPSLESQEQITAGDQSHVIEYRIETAPGSYSVAGAWNTANTNTNIAVAYFAGLVDSVATRANYSKFPKFLLRR